MTDPCEPCAIAERFPKTGLYTTNCRTCTARRIANSPAAWNAVHAITNVELQDAIEQAFGIDGYAEGRKLVWAQMQRMGVAR